jgi:hypothetical protein
MACEAEKQRVQDLLQQIKDFTDLQGATGFSKMTMAATWAWKYGTKDVNILQLRDQLEAARADLLACQGIGFAETIAGKTVGNVLRGLWSLTD